MEASFTQRLTKYVSCRLDQEVELVSLSHFLLPEILFWIKYKGLPHNSFVQIHSRKWTSIRVLYVLTRYYPLLIWPFELYVNISGHSVETCRKLMRPAYILQFPLVSDFPFFLLSILQK